MEETRFINLSVLFVRSDTLYTIDNVLCNRRLKKHAKGVCGTTLYARLMLSLKFTTYRKVIFIDQFVLSNPYC